MAARWLTLGVPPRVTIGLLLSVSVTTAVACTPLRPLDDGDDAASPARDAGPHDAGPPIDAPRDAALARDAFTFDAPGLDAPPPDAFSPDAWAPDAFLPADAYVPPDAWVSPSPVRPSTAGSVVFSELMIDPDGGDADEWVELYNPSASQSYDLRGCTLDGMATSHTIATSFVIPPRSYATAVADREPDFEPDYVYGRTAFLLEDDRDRVALVCGAVVIDEVSYTSMFPILMARSIMVESSVLGSMTPHVGNDAPGAWCSAPETARYSLRNYGTPGGINTCPP